MTDTDLERREIAGLFMARHGRRTEAFLRREAKIRGHKFGQTDRKIWLGILATVRAVREEL